MAKPRKRAISPVECICGCGEIFYTNRKNKRYKNAQHKMKCWDKGHPQQKLRLVPSIVLDGWMYDLTNRRRP